MVAILEKKKFRYMIYFIIGIVGTILWIAIEIYTAPTMDDDGKITKPGKKISNLWRKQS